jgi:hypothetical protein
MAAELDVAFAHITRDTVDSLDSRCVGLTNGVYGTLSSPGRKTYLLWYDCVVRGVMKRAVSRRLTWVSKGEEDGRGELSRFEVA